MRKIIQFRQVWNWQNVAVHSQLGSSAMTALACCNGPIPLFYIIFFQRTQFNVTNPDWNRNPVCHHGIPADTCMRCIDCLIRSPIWAWCGSRILSIMFALNVSCQRYSYCIFLDFYVISIDYIS